MSGSRIGSDNAEAIPHVRLHEVAGDAAAGVINDPEVVLAPGMALLRRSAIPTNSFGVMGLASPVTMQHSERVLGWRVTQLRCLQIPAYRLLLVPPDAVSTGVGVAKIQLRVQMALLSYTATITLAG